MSAIRSVLVHLDATGASVDRLAFARELAGRHGAALTALFGVQPDPAHADFAYSAGAALRAAEAGAAAHWAVERARLQDLCAHAAPVPTWCEVIGDTVTHGFLAEAAYADLLVVGAPADAHHPAGPPPGFVEAAILESGTPAIVVPRRRLPSIARRVLVAWNESPAATRAVHAALPLLAAAEQVDVVTWGPSAPTAPYSRIDIGAWLRRHEIAARVQRRPSTPRIGDALAALTGELGSDLVVMGCYGHARLRERVFGGVTRSLLSALPVPLLMSH